MDIPITVEKKKKKKKREQRFCINNEGCVYRSYFGSRCIAAKRVVWRTCRFKTKTPGGKNGED